MTEKATPASSDAEANDAAGQAADQAPETSAEDSQSAPGTDDVKQKFRAALDRKRAEQHDHQSSGGRGGKIAGTHGPVGGSRSFRRKSG
jgi:hypothetical protein